MPDARVTAAPSPLALATIAALGLINLGRGGIHLFAPDGGAVSIAGLDVTPAPQTILFLFGSLGVGQIALGLVDMAAAWRWRSFVRPLLAIHLVQLALAVLALFAIKPPPVFVPGQWFNLALFVLIAVIAGREFLTARRT